VNLIDLGEIFGGENSRRDRDFGDSITQLHLSPFGRENYAINLSGQVTPSSPFVFLPSCLLLFCFASPTRKALVCLLRHGALFNVIIFHHRVSFLMRKFGVFALR
jgi:hypothetical protein